MLDLEVTTAAEASRMRRLRKLTHVSRMLTHATSLDQVLSLTVTEAALLLEGSRAALLLYDPSGCLQVRATHAVTGAVLRSELETPDTSLEQILRAVLGEGFESNAVAVPLIVSGKVTGALAVIRGESAISEEEEEWLLSALADQTMVAIEKERLDEIQGRAEQQALIARVGHRLLQRHDVQGLFDEISSSVSATLGIDLVGIFGRQPEGTFALLGGVGWSTPHPAPTTMEHGRTSWESHAFGSNNPVAFGATDADDRASSEAFLRDPRVTSGLVVAIEPPSKYGVLGVYSRTPREFSHEERDVLASLATLLSSALEREAAETQLRAAAEMRDDLLAIVSHDLRGPLFAIISAASLLADEDTRGDDASLTHCVGVIHRNGQRMAGMIKDLLDFESLRGAGLSVTVAEHAIGTLLEEALETVEPQAAAKSLHLESHAPGPATAWFDRERTLQILSNLLGNAVKFTPNGGTITLTAELLSAEVRISVRDTGPGIPPDDAPHVFDRYWQAQRSDRRGIGLGLPIARGLVEAQGGKLWVESALGVGTTFFFTLPAHDLRRALP